jgi:hypothetical protein
LVGPCDACSRLTELFQLPGRKGSNRAECNSDIATLVELAGHLAIGERQLGSVFDLMSAIFYRAFEAGFASMPQLGFPIQEYCQPIDRFWKFPPNLTYAPRL